jgi:tetratricopeptide (TPR) repeat protein
VITPGLKRQVTDSRRKVDLGNMIIPTARMVWHSKIRRAQEIRHIAMSNLMLRKSINVVFVILVCAARINAQGGAVKVTESTIQIPTYLLGSEDPNPPFQLLNERGVYPYTMLDDLTDHREPLTYRSIVLENEYLRATILPELGGRLYSLYDKVSGREVFYRNRSVKYGLVALRGAWISGGIEFNFPSGHTTDTVSAVSSRYQMNTDGSATVFVGDVDQASEMYWQVALTLRPGVARLDQQVQLFNPTPVEKLYWYWNNAAVPATKDARFIYPMRLANPGSFSELRTFPDWHGVDYSRYESFREPSELFGVDVHRNFFGVYYDNANYGVVHFADFREVTGKKFWTWGVGGDGAIWTDLLTDADGPYNEIQAGRFETQLTQDFLPPQAVESWTESWYPVRQLVDGFVEATKQLAINVSFEATTGAKGAIRVSVSPTEQINNASVQVSLDGKIVKSFSQVNFKPADTRKFVIPVADANSARNKAVVDILGDSGRVLLHWSAAEPVDGNSDSLQQRLTDIQKTTGNMDQTAEDLYLHGALQDKQGNHADALQLFKEALKRDPKYIPALRELAMREYLDGDFNAAKDYIEKAILLNKSDAQTEYDAGIIWRAAGETARARDALWASVRLGEPSVPALMQLGEIALCSGELDRAEDLLRRALSYNPHDGLVRSDLSIALRRNKELAEAAKVAAGAVESMPLYPPALAERWRVAAMQDADSAVARSAHREWSHAVGDRLQGYLEAGAWYWSLNDFDSSEFILRAALRELSDKELSPIIYYYLASSARHRGREEESLDYATKARAARIEKIFINRNTDAEVLQEALLAGPNDAHAQYLLGGYMFQHRRYEEADRLWMQAKASGLEYSVLDRNLGVSAWKVRKNLDEARSFYERAVQLDPQDYRLYVDLDEIDAQLGATEARARLFEGAPSGVLDHDAARIRYIGFLVNRGQYDRALSLLKDHSFKPWEQGVDVQELFAGANIQKGRLELSSRHFAQAEEAFTHALEYPTNLGVGKPDRPNDAAAQYWLGEARNDEGDSEGAKRKWEMLVDEEGRGDLSRYYGALALERLGRKSEAVSKLTELAEGPAHGRRGGHNYYVAGLAESHLGNGSQAAEYLHKALEVSPSLWQAEGDVDK